MGKKNFEENIGETMAGKPRKPIPVQHLPYVSANRFGAVISEEKRDSIKDRLLPFGKMENNGIRFEISIDRDGLFQALLYHGDFFIDGLTGYKSVDDLQIDCIHKYTNLLMCLLDDSKTNVAKLQEHMGIDFIKSIAHYPTYVGSRCRSI